ncbi:MAG: class I SAM-dependent methyltransferase [Dehalococcoidia bacterium]
MARRLRGSGEAPWIAPAAVRYLSRVVHPDWHVVECGAGMSTLWWAKRAARVTSLEHDVAWCARLRQHLDEDRITNVDLQHVRLTDLVSRLIRLNPTVDLAFVDSSEEGTSNRVACVEVLCTKLRPGGLLVLDDSDRRRYRAIDGMLADWPVRRFVGIKGHPFVAVETSVYVRPLGLQGPIPASGGSCDGYSE